MNYNNSINLRNEFNGLLNEFGINVLYIRHSKKMKCKCYDELYKVGDMTCKDCFGTGKVVKAKIVKTIRKNSLGDFDKLKLGYQISKDTVFYFDYKFEPKNGDYILIVKYDKNNYARVVDDVYEITYSNETRADNGRIEFYNTKVVLRNDRKYIFEKWINSMDLSKRKSLKDGRCINVRTV